MTHDEAENFLAHYGKVGMKWGVRRALSTGKLTEKSFNKSADRGDVRRRSNGLQGRKYTAVDGSRYNVKKGVNALYAVKLGAAVAGTAGAVKLSSLIKNPSLQLGATAASVILGAVVARKSGESWLDDRNSIKRQGSNPSV